MDTIDIKDKPIVTKEPEESGNASPPCEDTNHVSRRHRRDDSKQAERKQRSLDLEEDLFNNVPV